MHLQKLHILDFKNYEDTSLQFPAKVNCFLGANGSGKTNLLDAIYYLSATRSFLNSSDSHTIRFGRDIAIIKGDFIHHGTQHEISCQLQTGRKKIFREDSTEYSKLSDHIGKYPVVLISPTDIDLVHEGSESRRKFFDHLISLLDHSYLDWLVEYHHTVKQRNNLLGMFISQNFRDDDLIESYDQQLVRTGMKIWKKRSEFIREFQPVFNSAYSKLTDLQEKAELSFRSEVGANDYNRVLKQNFHRDLQLGRTTFGIHRDDYEFKFAHGELKKLGSQGQQKSFLVALKLAQFEVIKAHKGYSPILLLDDIFDKLDTSRITRLLWTVTAGSIGQLFITDAGEDRTRTLLRKLKIESDIFNVVNGVVAGNHG